MKAQKFEKNLTPIEFLFYLPMENLTERPTLPVIIELQYLPCLEFFVALLQHEVVYIEAHEHFQKQTYRNRCYIQTTNKIDLLTVPVQDSRSKVLIRDLRIEYRQDWVRRHWGAIFSAYGKAPFFEYFAYVFEKTFQKKPAFLFDLNWELLTNCLKLLRIEENRIKWTEKFEKSENQPIIDLRSVISPKKLFSERSIYSPIPYRQNFGSEFEPNLSILDLLFCQGTEAKKILEKSSANLSSFVGK